MLTTLCAEASNLCAPQDSGKKQLHQRQHVYCAVSVSMARAAGNCLKLLHAQEQLPVVPPADLARPSTLLEGARVESAIEVVAIPPQDRWIALEMFAGTHQQYLAKAALTSAPQSPMVVEVSSCAMRIGSKNSTTQRNSREWCGRSMQMKTSSGQSNR